MSNSIPLSINKLKKKYKTTALAQLIWLEGHRKLLMIKENSWWGKKEQQNTNLTLYKWQLPFTTQTQSLNFPMLPQSPLCCVNQGAPLNLSFGKSVYGTLYQLPLRVTHQCRGLYSRKSEGNRGEHIVGYYITSAWELAGAQELCRTKLGILGQCCLLWRKVSSSPCWITTNTTVRNLKN